MYVISINAESTIGYVLLVLLVLVLFVLLCHLFYICCRPREMVPVYTRTGQLSSVLGRYNGFLKFTEFKIIMDEQWVYISPDTRDIKNCMTCLSLFFNVFDDISFLYPTTHRLKQVYSQRLSKELEEINSLSPPGENYTVIHPRASHVVFQKIINNQSIESTNCFYPEVGQVRYFNCNPKVVREKYLALSQTLLPAQPGNFQLSRLTGLSGTYHFNTMCYLIEDLCFTLFLKDSNENSSKIQKKTSSGINEQIANILHFLYPQVKTLQVSHFNNDYFCFPTTGFLIFHDLDPEESITSGGNTSSANDLTGIFNPAYVEK